MSRGRIKIAVNVTGCAAVFYQEQESGDSKQTFDDGASGSGANSANTKLPKIPLPKFSGQAAIEWFGLEDQFKAAVDKNEALHDVQKLAYFKSCLTDEVAESIQPYMLTEDNYALVVEFLKKRFRKNRLIKQAHMDAIVDLPKFDSMEINEVRYFLDTLESNLRSVVSLGVQNELLAPLLIPLLMRKLPKKLIEKFKFKIKDDNNRIFAPKISRVLG